MWNTIKKKKIKFIIRCLRGCVSVLEIVFVGQCEVFVCLDFVHLFSLAAKLIGLQK